MHPILSHKQGGRESHDKMSLQCAQRGSDLDFSDLTILGMVSSVAVAFFLLKVKILNNQPLLETES